MIHEIRIALIDDHEMVLQGLGALLDSQTGLKVIAKFKSGEDAAEQLEMDKVDVILTDINMPGFNYEQVLSYMKFRVAPYGEWDKLELDDADIEHFYLSSGGLAGGINVLARTHLEQRLQPRAGGRDYGRPMMLFSLFVLAIAGFILFQNFQREEQVQTRVVYEAPPAQDSSSFADLSASRESLSLRLSEQLALEKTSNETGSASISGDEP